MSERIPRATIDLTDTPLHEVTQQYGADGLYMQYLQYVDRLDIDDEHRAQLYAAAALTMEVHAGQERGEHPYATHPLRVASRIIDHFDVSDPAIITAALLHDSVEDMPGRLVLGPEVSVEVAEDSRYQKRALTVIRDTFDAESAQIVQAVTNPTFDPDVNQHQQYREHVVDMMEHNPKARIVKFSDFLDNCMGLNHNEMSPDRVRRLAHKYYPLIPIMEHFADDPSTPLPDAGRHYILDGLVRARVRCEQYMTE